MECRQTIKGGRTFILYLYVYLFIYHQHSFSCNLVNGDYSPFGGFFTFLIITFYTLKQLLISLLRVALRKKCAGVVCRPRKGTGGWDGRKGLGWFVMGIKVVCSKDRAVGG